MSEAASPQLPLIIQKEMEELQKLYTQASTVASFNAMVYGTFGTGKTSLLKTARKPVLVDSFDPGGTKVLRDEIAKGTIIADTRWELEDPKNPSVFGKWDQSYTMRKRNGLFNHLGTYAIDSVTMWSEAAMNVTLQKVGRAGGYAYQQDYNPTMAMISAAIRDMVTLPCDVILICHEDVEKDEASGRMFVGPLLTGKTHRQKMPLLFDELYCAVTKPTSTGANYLLLTRNDGMYKARTRLGMGGKFETYEQQDIKALLKKAGYPTDDKPLFTKQA